MRYWLYLASTTAGKGFYLFAVFVVSMSVVRADDLSFLRTEEGSERFTKNVSAIAAQTSKLGFSLAKLVETYELGEDLELSDEQMRLLRAVEVLDPAELYSEISPKNPLFLQEKEFASFLPKLKKRYEQQRKVEDKKVEGVLIASQLRRLRQIGTQLYLTFYLNPEVAFQYHGKTVTNETLSTIRNALGKHRNLEIVERSLLTYRNKLLAIQDVVGTELKRRIGTIHAFGYPLVSTDFKELYFSRFRAALDLLGFQNKSRILALA